MNGMTLGAKASPALTHSPRSGAQESQTTCPRARFERTRAGLKGLAENEPGGQTGKGWGWAEEGALPRDQQALVVALLQLVLSSYICGSARCWAPGVQR